MARLLQNPVVVLGLLLGLLPASAQDVSAVPVPAASPPAQLTGKERLGRKWMDEQRIDNCNVPIEKRGTRPRSSVCHKVPTG